MTLTREQYDSIMAGYARTRERHHREQAARREEIYEKIPAFRALCEDVPQSGLEALMGRLSGRADVPSHEQLSQRFADIAEQKRQLLAANGYPADYLESVYDCPDCHDTGYIDGKKCHCFREQEISLLYDQSHIRDLVRTENFEHLSHRYYQGEDLVHFQKAEAICRRFAADFDHLHQQNLYLYGTVGTGKSFLSLCVAERLLESGHSVLYFSASALFDRLGSFSFDRASRQERQAFTDDLYHCDLLIIDDLGTELTNQFVASSLFELINERHLNKRATIISTNLSMSELRSRYSDRVWSRIVDGYTLCRLSGPDIRVLRKTARR